MEKQCNGKQFKFKVSHTMWHSGTKARSKWKNVRVWLIQNLGYTRYLIDKLMVYIGKWQ